MAVQAAQRPFAFRFLLHTWSPFPIEQNSNPQFAALIRCRFLPPAKTASPHSGAPPGECIRTYIKPWDGDFVPARIDPGVWQSRTYPLWPLARSPSMKAVQQPISFSAVIKTFARGNAPDAQGCQYGIPSYGYLASGAH